MKFLLYAAINGIDEPNTATGESFTQQERFRKIVREAVLADKLGFDAYGVGERHTPEILNSSPSVLLSHIAALTSRIRLVTTVAVLSILDPVRVAEDYATLDHLAEGRLDMMIGKGSDPRQWPLFGISEETAREQLAERYTLLRRLWNESGVTWEGRFRPPLNNVTTQPRPYQQQIRVWHAGSRHLFTAENAARNGDALFLTASGPDRAPYKAVYDHYRERWAYYGRDPAKAHVGMSGGFMYLANTTEEAIRRFQPYYDGFLNTSVGKQNNTNYSDLRDYVKRGQILVGSPQDVIDKILSYHGDYKHQLVKLLVDGLAESEQEEQLVRFTEEVAPIVRREAPNPLWEK